MKITIDTSNAAFQPEENQKWKREVSRILEELAANVRKGNIIRTLVDINGNTVGRVDYTD
jgi:hypothetical protein